MALATLQDGLRDAGGDLVIVTQNVDDLHERGGARDIIHMHGSLTMALCAACGHRWPCRTELTVASQCPACQSVGSPRPDIVWFGEMPYHIARIEAELARADLFVSVGTSGAVYPAAGFVQMARQAGIRTLELNLEPSLGSHWFHETRNGPAGTIVPDWAEETLAALASVDHLP
nr:Sir2 family NAD-dependent protein deacetylase [Algimonas porphyrae]